MKNDLYKMLFQTDGDKWRINLTNCTKGCMQQKNTFHNE